MTNESERAAFEKWHCTTYPDEQLRHCLIEGKFYAYQNDTHEHRWDCWQARAALDAKKCEHNEQLNRTCKLCARYALDAKNDSPDSVTGNKAAGAASADTVETPAHGTELPNNSRGCHADGGQDDFPIYKTTFSTTKTGEGRA